METWMLVLIGIISLILLIVSLVQIFKEKKELFWGIMFIIAICGLLYVAGVHMDSAEIERMIDAIPTSN